MSRIGKKPIEIPEGVEIKIDGRKVIIKGPKGELSREVRPEVKIEINKKQIIVSLLPGSKQASAFWGLERALLQNMVLGVTKGFRIEVSVKGKRIIVVGIDKAVVGQFAAKARKAKPPDPYKGKGVRYVDEEVKLKPGKKAATAAA